MDYNKIFFSNLLLLIFQLYLSSFYIVLLCYVHGWTTYLYERFMLLLYVYTTNISFDKNWERKLNKKLN